MSKRFVAGFILVITAQVQAQMPHEVLLLVNARSQASMKVANTYAAARGIPQRNMVYLDIPESIYGGTATITPEQFSQLIWEPANAATVAREIDRQILAWVYSVDFPIRVRTDANDRRQMSVLGLTFMRNQPPEPEAVEKATYQSKLFAGPNEQLKLSLRSLSLRMFRDGVGEASVVPDEVSYLKPGLGSTMPLPAMMLGYIGEKGTDIKTVLETIQRGVRSDYRARTPSRIFFVQSDDVRSTCREWQYYPVVNELGERRVTATVVTNFPAGEKDLMGILMGAETVDPSQVGSFAPGAMAEHLTSWSAEFQKPQTKLTAWLEAGATGTAGAVVEPYSNPDKFPSARFFLHYASGCTMLESFYQSIACPLQILLLGEPLARPYAPPINVGILGADLIKDDFTYLARAESRVPGMEFTYEFLMDGKPFHRKSAESAVWVPLYGVADGYHELRAVVRPIHPVEFGVFADKPFIVNGNGRSVEILTGEIVKTGKHTHDVKVAVGGEEMPETVRLVCGERVLDEKAYDEEARLQLDELAVGEGPTRIQAVAVYADGMQVASPPLPITIAFAP